MAIFIIYDTKILLFNYGKSLAYRPNAMNPLRVLFLIFNCNEFVKQKLINQNVFKYILLYTSIP